MFLSKTELKSATVPEVVDKAINADDTIVDIIIAESIAEMKSYLSDRFDIAEIFAATDEDRNLVIVKHLKKIVVDEIYRRKTGELNEATAKGYDEAMYWLKEVAKGSIDAGELPPKPLPDGQTGVGDGFIKFGSKLKYPTDF